MASRSIPLLAAAAFAAIVPPALLHFWGREKVLVDGWIHFSGVAVGAGLATLSAVVLTIVGARQRDGYAVLVGCAFSVMAALLLLHGLATPGILVDGYGVSAFTGGATLPIGGAILALGALSALRRPAAVRPLLWLLGAGVVFILALGIAAMVEPGLVPAVPEPRSTAALIVLAAGLAFYAILFWRALRTYRLTRRGADLVVAVGIVWLAAALPAALLLSFRDLGWWLGHAFEVVGIAAVGFTVAHDLRRGAARSRPLLGDLGGADLVVEAEDFLGSHIRALLAELAEKDAYTEEHTRRVALRAAQVGDELGLSPGRLRDLAIGGLLHDIG
ncbi:MAG TPA: HD domain-containing protein, partial [Gaiellaceae bacterium]|nr:HD domain-containing protein [Gaiellaceae bacterium]